jgi:hypothetical protein
LAAVPDWVFVAVPAVPFAVAAEVEVVPDVEAGCVVVLPAGGPKSEVGAAVVPKVAEVADVDDGLLPPKFENKLGFAAESEVEVFPPKLGNKLGFDVEVEAELFPPKLGNKLGVGAGVDAGADEVGAALDAGVEENMLPSEGAVEPEVLVDVVVAGFPNIPPGLGA